MPKLLNLISSGVRVSRLTQSSTDGIPTKYSSAGPSNQSSNGGMRTPLNNHVATADNQQYLSTAYELYGSQVTPSYSSSHSSVENSPNLGQSQSPSSKECTSPHAYNSGSAAPQLEPRLPTPVGQHLQPLPCPVIIPQRRPKDKERGFLYAYSPVLHDCGIDEETFLDFLRNLNQACKTSKIFDAVNYGSIAAGMVPNITTQVYGIAARLAIESTKWMQSGHKVNQYLYRMNEELFKPRGLFCLIMTYKPPEEAQHSSRATDLINSTTASMKMRVQSLFGPMEMSSGTSEPTLPEHAPLVFPKNPSKFMLGGMATRHMDRQAQLEYIRRVRDLSQGHSSSQLAALYPIKNDASQPYLPSQREAEDLHNTRRLQIGSRRSQLNAITAAIRDTLKQEVLYLMIVNMPTPEELDVALT